MRSASEVVARSWPAGYRAREAASTTRVGAPAPVCVRKRPSIVAPVCTEMDVCVRKLPTISDRTPIVEDDPTFQKTLSALASRRVRRQIMSETTPMFAPVRGATALGCPPMTTADKRTCEIKMKK